MSLIADVTKEIGLNYFFDRNKNDLVISYRILNVDGKLRDREVFKLGAFIDSIHKKGLIHGDIHLRNILFQDRKLALVDWEPCFLQKVKLKTIIKCNSRSIALEDRRKKKITKLSDRKGYSLILCDYLNIKYSQVPNLEKDLQNLNCEEIFIQLLKLKYELQGGIQY